jgi:hypothetical protein
MVGWDDPTTTCGSSWNKISANPKIRNGRKPRKRIAFVGHRKIASG